MEPFHDDVVVHRPMLPGPASRTQQGTAAPPRALMRRYRVGVPRQPMEPTSTTCPSAEGPDAPTARASHWTSTLRAVPLRRQRPLSAATVTPSDAQKAHHPSCGGEFVPPKSILYLLEAYERAIFPLLVQAHADLCTLCHKAPGAGEGVGGPSPHAASTTNGATGTGARCSSGGGDGPNDALLDAVAVFGTALHPITGELSPRRWRALCSNGARQTTPSTILRTWMLLATVLRDGIAIFHRGTDPNAQQSTVVDVPTKLFDAIGSVVRGAPPLLLPVDALPQPGDMTRAPPLAPSKGAAVVGAAATLCSHSIEPSLHHHHQHAATVATWHFPSVGRLAATIACNAHSVLRGVHEPSQGPTSDRHGTPKPPAAATPRRCTSSAGLSQFRVPFRGDGSNSTSATVRASEPAAAPPLPAPSTCGMVSTQLWLNQLRQLLMRHQLDCTTFLATHSTPPPTAVAVGKCSGSLAMDLASHGEASVTVVRQHMSPASLRSALHAYFRSSLGALPLPASAPVHEDDDDIATCFAERAAAAVPWPSSVLTVLQQLLSTPRGRDTAQHAATLLTAVSRTLADVFGGSGATTAALKAWQTCWHPDNVQSALNSAIASVGRCPGLKASSCNALRHVVLDSATRNAQQIACVRDALEQQMNM